MTGPASSHAVICAGRLYCDLILGGLDGMPEMGKERYAADFSAHAGGGAFITAAHFVALGRAGHLLSQMPEGPFADLLRADLDASGVSVLDGRTSPGGPPQVTVAMVGERDRAFLTHRTGEAIPATSPASIRKSAAGHLHIGELPTALDHPELIATARACGMTISLDCGWDEGAFRNRQVAHVLTQIDVFLPNAPEAAALAEAGIDLTSCPLTIVKQGAAGATAYHSGRTVHRPADPVRVVDPTGAGDAFNAGAVDAWLRGAAPEACVTAGNAQGQAAVTRRGGATGLCRPAPAAVLT
ncbi:MAG: PfkB family carbohydrate kinase [Pseudomonadota bacterium]